jgi:cytoskeleton protein RodZ
MQTIGERLEDARKKRGVSIREAAEAIKVRSDYLQKFESNQFNIGLTEIYVRGFLRNYAFYLRIPPERILNDFSALGRGEPRPRSPNREIYGRMEVSVTAKDDRSEPPPPPEPPEVEEEAPGAGQPRAPRKRNALPTTPLVDQATIYKAGIFAAALVGIGLIFWGAKAFLSGRSASMDRPAAVSSAPVPIEMEPGITLVALDTVRVRVSSVADNSILLPDTTLDRGQTQIVARSGPVYISSSDGDNLQVEVNGKRYGMPYHGQGVAKLP